MLGCVFGQTPEKLQEKLSSSGRTFEAWRKIGAIVGTGDQIREQLQEVELAGVQRVMLQWLDLDDIEGLS